MRRCGMIHTQVEKVGRSEPAKEKMLCLFATLSKMYEMNEFVRWCKIITHSGRVRQTLCHLPEVWMFWAKSHSSPALLDLCLWEYAWYLERSFQGLWVGIHFPASSVFFSKAHAGSPQIRNNSSWTYMQDASGVIVTLSYRGYQMVCQWFHQLNLHV